VLAEQLGFHRYWFAEHHGIAGLASSAPEILTAHVLARTSRIRVGTGGVMLQHYAPFKVAESFNLLASLSPGRVDLGVGKAPGGLPHATRALRPGQSSAALRISPKSCAISMASSPGTCLPITPMPGRSPHPSRPSPPAASCWAPAPTAPRWPPSWTGTSATPVISMAIHAAWPPPSIFIVTPQGAALLALVAFAAPSEEEARRLIGPYRLLRLHLPTGQTVNVPNLEVAAEFARQAGVSDYTTQEIEPNVLSGMANSSAPPWTN
jgi:hypothetical protein